MVASSLVTSDVLFSLISDALIIFHQHSKSRVILHKSMKCNHQSMCCVVLCANDDTNDGYLFLCFFLFVCRCCCVIFKCSLLFCSRSASVSCLLYLQLLIMHRRIWYLLRLRCWGEKLGPKKMRCVNGQSRRGERENPNWPLIAIFTMHLQQQQQHQWHWQPKTILQIVSMLDIRWTRLTMMLQSCCSPAINDRAVPFFQDKWMWESAFASENDNREISNFNDCCRVILVRSFVYSEFFFNNVILLILSKAFSLFFLTPIWQSRKRKRHNKFWFRFCNDKVN